MPSSSSMGAWIRGPIIGRGSSATVSLASSPPSSELFAVKSVHLSHSALLHMEESILSTLTCPNIISCLGSDVTSHNGRLYCNLFLEYAPGGSLSDHIKRQPCGRLDEPSIRSRTSEILTGLSYLHLRGIAHCDIKSQNVLIGSDGRAKIADLGCARRMDVGDGGGCSQQIRGTPLFMAPEVVRGEEQGAAADVWALGCTVIEMATGRSPWPEASDYMTAIQAIGFSEQVPGLPDWDSEEGKDFLDRCLKRDPTERWTAEQLLKHPFMSVTNTSPKSTLDQYGLWESLLLLSDAEEDDDDDDDDDEGGLAVDHEQRIGKMARSCGGGPNWSWGETWVSVRCNSSTSSGEDQECSDAPQLEDDPQTNSGQDTTIPSMSSTTDHDVLLSSVHDIEHVSYICNIIHLDGRFAIKYENENQLFSCKISEFYDQCPCWYDKDDDSVNQQKQSSLCPGFLLVVVLFSISWFPTPYRKLVGFLWLETKHHMFFLPRDC